jgi:hypothetical protein
LLAVFSRVNLGPDLFETVWNNQAEIELSRCVCLESAMDDRDQRETEDRRKFLISAGRFAAVTPPAITLLLSTSLTSDAIAHSGAKGSRGNNGYGNGGDDGSPNGKTDKYR